MFAVILLFTAIQSIFSIVRRECKTISLKGFQNAEYTEAFSLYILFGSVFYLYEYRPHFSYNYIYHWCIVVINVNRCMDMFCDRNH